MKNYILDTSAILTFIENEAGVEDVERLLLDAVEGKIQILISAVSAIELYYVSLREQGKTIADERLQLIDGLPIKQQPLHPDMAKIIGEIKADKSMSFADCCIAGLAKIHKAIVVHKDPEFEQIKDELRQHRLPYKNV